MKTITTLPEFIFGDPSHINLQPCHIPISIWHAIYSIHSWDWITLCDFLFYKDINETVIFNKILETNKCIIHPNYIDVFMDLDGYYRLQVYYHNFEKPCTPLNININ